MNNISKVFISTVAFFLASETEAVPIHNSCLVLSDITAGYENGEFMTNEDQLTSSIVTDDMRIHSFKTCTNSNGFITGLQFFMAANPYSKEDQEAVETVEMGAIGKMEGECQTLKLTGGLDRIRAYKGALKGVRSIRFYRGNLAKTYGKMKDEYT